MTESNLANVPCTQLKGVGPKLAERLQKCNINSLQDLLFHLPYRYQDRTRITPIAHCRIGDHAVIEAEIINAQIKFSGKPSLLLTVRDGSGQIQLRFFHFNASQKQQLVAGVVMRCFGEVRHSNLGRMMIHPEYRSVNDETVVPVEETLTPIYSVTAGLQQRSLRQLTEQALTRLEQSEVDDYIPEAIRESLNLSLLTEAIQFVHRPPPNANLNRLETAKHPAQQRLAFEELLSHQLCMLKLRQSLQQIESPAMMATDEHLALFLQNLSFQLTAAQVRVNEEIKQDLEKTVPMMRLVQGDVGSGKTVVAACAALQAIEAGFQTAIMAPTEILAEQHYKNMSAWLAPLGIEVAWLSGKLKARPRRESIAAIASGSARLIVGTHALFQKEVSFEKLGLVIIDEQHRFGVHQRMALREKGEIDGKIPHQLVMTATPIPRTLAMTAYANLDISIIDELPPGRTPVTTVVLANEKREQVIERIQSICQQKRQAYWVCTLIEESESLQCQAAEDAATLLKEALPNITIGLIHGRLKSEEKEMIMQQFKQGDIDLLVATTVIEVGVDVPNASLMVIENPERLGLAQLHQLRGRVGRGAQDSYCVLLYQHPLSQESRERLRVLRDHTSGFDIAQKDLELRGPGEVLGTRQTGLAQMKIADILRDSYMLDRVQQTAKLITAEYPKAIEPLINRWIQDGEKYGKVS